MINISPTSQITKIYLVTNCFEDPNKIYIGQTRNCRKNSHQRKYGKQITYDYIDEVNSYLKEDWEPLETFWIRYFKFLGFEVQNKNEGGGGLNFHSEKTRINISKNNLGKPKSNTHRVNISLGRKGISCTQEAKDKIGRANKGKPSCNKGKNLSQTHKNNISKSNKGRTLSEETKHIMSISHLKPVLQFTKYGELINEFKSRKEAIEKTGIDCQFVLVNKAKTAGGYIFIYKNNWDGNPPILKPNGNLGKSKNNLKGRISPNKKKINEKICNRRRTW